MSLLELKSPRAVETFEQAQALSSRRLGFSVTQACPLRCRHCSVEAGPEHVDHRFQHQFTEQVLAQMNDISDAGVVSIDFTGGEPTLAAPFVTSVAAAAAAHGISTGIVTAAHWARTEEQAERFLDRFSMIQHWDISTDLYHLEFVSLDAVERAFRMLEERGKTPLVRIAYHEPIERPDALLIEQVMAFAGRRVGFQPIGPVGRGADVSSAPSVPREDAGLGACPTTGLLIRWDGRSSACCAPASHDEQDHPFWLGDASTTPIVELLARWRTHPLLQTVRIWGFGPVLEWLEEAGHDCRRIFSARECDLCVGFLRDEQAIAIAQARASELSHRITVAKALLEFFNEPWLDLQLRAEADQYLATGRWPGYPV